MAVHDDATRPNHDATTANANDATRPNVKVYEPKRNEATPPDPAAKLYVDGADATADAGIEYVLWRQLGAANGHELFEKLVQWPRVWVNGPTTPRGN